MDKGDRTAADFDACDASFPDAAAGVEKHWNDDIFAVNAAAQRELGFAAGDPAPPAAGNEQHAADLDDDGDCDTYDIVALLNKLNE